MDFFEEKLAFLLHSDKAQSDEDRLKMCIDQLFENPIIIDDTKSINNAIMFNAKARTAMSNKDYEGAADFYTKGLQEVLPYCEVSAILYANRATALGCLKMYEESLIDIDRAIKISPNTELTKNFKDIKMELKKEASRPNTKPNNRNHFEDIPSLSHDENIDISSMSNAVCLFHRTNYGTYFQATKTLYKGDVILIEKPQVTSFCQSDVAVANMCHYCLKWYRALLPCEQCNSALYCSKECRAKAYEEYHRIQCNSKNFPDDVQFVINLFMKITENGKKLTEAIKYCEELDTMNADPDKEFCTIRDNLRNNLKSVLNLSISMKKNDKKNEKNITKSAYIASFLRNQTNYLQGYNDILSVAKLLFRLFYIFHAHASLVYTRSNDREEVSKVYILYSWHSFGRHSCHSNTFSLIHKNGVITVHVLKQINKGEEITFSVRCDDQIPKFRDDYTYNYTTIPRIVFKNISNCSTCESCSTSKLVVDRKLRTTEVFERRLRKQRFDIHKSWEMTMREIGSV